MDRTAVSALTPSQKNIRERRKDDSDKTPSSFLSTFVPYHTKTQQPDKKKVFFVFSPSSSLATVSANT